jgi:hypothetical protein
MLGELGGVCLTRRSYVFGETTLVTFHASVYRLVPPDRVHVHPDSCPVTVRFYLIRLSYCVSLHVGLL